MADPKELAQKARATLGEALQALQSSPDVPEQLLDAAEPIARAMGILHKIEKSNGTVLDGREEALEITRKALDALQALDTGVPAVESAMESVAGSLSKLYALVKAEAPRGAVRPPPSHQPAVPQPAAQPAFAQPPQAAPFTQPPQPAPFAQPQAQPAPFAQQPAYQPPSSPPARPQPQGFGPGGTVMQATPQRTQPLQGTAFQASPVGAPVQDRRDFELAATEPLRRVPPNQPQQAPAREAPSVSPPRRDLTEDDRVAGTQGTPVPPPGTVRVDVELGAHSGSNFYKGLSGNDVVEHGGLFVATYKIPKMGTAVALRVHLPGDLEFDADAVVAWTRETRDGETEPGFGARLTRVSKEGRQLVYRYVRNREPIFYDDM